MLDTGEDGIGDQCDECCFRFERMDLQFCRLMNGEMVYVCLGCAEELVSNGEMDPKELE